MMGVPDHEIITIFEDPQFGAYVNELVSGAIGEADPDGSRSSGSQVL